MPIGILFWMLMIIWIVFGSYSVWPNYALFGGNLLLWVLLALLGWHAFGSIIH
jgi:hypothetical protein